MKTGASWPIIGHTHAVKFLQRSVERGPRAHAFLFAGMANIGKETLARTFAQALLCHDHHQRTKQAAPATPCGQCSVCTSFLSGTHPDVYTVTRAEDKTSISIDQIRELIERLAHSSFLNSYRIALIIGAEQLQPQAANALLKLLEEPGARTIILMTATDAQAVLPTIASRTQVIHCLPVPEAQIYAELVERGSARDDARDIAAIACGRPGIALHFAADREVYAAYRASIRSIESALDGSRAARSAAVAAALKEADDQRAAGQTLIADILSVLRGKLHGSPRSAATGFDALIVASERIARSVSPQVAIEDALFSIHS